MRVIKLKDRWDPNDGSLILNNRITEPGLSAYRNAVDATFQYNVQRREVYRAKQMSSKHIEKEAEIQKNCEITDAKSASQLDDPMRQFFIKHHTTKEDHS